MGSVTGSGRSPGGEHGNPLQFSCLENPIDRGAWQATVHRVTRSWTQVKQLSMHARLDDCPHFRCQSQNYWVPRLPMLLSYSYKSGFPQHPSLRFNNLLNQLIELRKIFHSLVPVYFCFMAESEEELKSLWMKVKEKSKKAGLKLNIQKTKIKASGPITSWQIDGKTVETVTDFIFLGFKITADGDCSHEIKRCLFLERKAMTNLDSILKSRDITLPTKFCIIKAMVFQ